MLIGVFFLGFSVGCSSPDTGGLAELEAHVSQLEKQPTATAASPASFAPGLGEIMGLDQIRHDKLWFAGENGNWPLAAYELDELQEGLDDAVKYHPTHEKVRRAGPARAALYSSPLEQLRATVKAKDKTGFARDRCADDRLQRVPCGIEPRIRRREAADGAP